VKEIGEYYTILPFSQSLFKKLLPEDKTKQLEISEPVTNLGTSSLSLENLGLYEIYPIKLKGKVER
jgi:hypothetical protein